MIAAFPKADSFLSCREYSLFFLFGMPWCPLQCCFELEACSRMSGITFGYAIPVETSDTLQSQLMILHLKLGAVF